jgi:hypothetical protein
MSVMEKISWSALNVTRVPRCVVFSPFSIGTIGRPRS